MYKPICICVAALAVTAGCVASAPAVPEQGMVAAVEDEAVDVVMTRPSAPDDPNALVCTNETRTGTRLPTRVCKTHAQLAMERELAQRMATTRGMSDGTGTSTHIAPPRVIQGPSH